jgi:proteic killer suppression protein
MIGSFSHKGLERFFVTGSKSGIAPQHASRLRLILARLQASARPEDMNLPGLMLHQLTGDRAGTWSVRVNANWRVMFRFEGDEALDVDYEDYH